MVDGTVDVVKGTTVYLMKMVLVLWMVDGTVDVVKGTTVYLMWMVLIRITLQLQCRLP